MQLEFTVTQEDLNEGVRRDCLRCPVARALARALNKRELPGAPVFVTYGFIEYTHSSPLLVEMEKGLLTYLGAIDFGKDPQPCSFTVEYPDQVLMDSDHIQVIASASRRRRYLPTTEEAKRAFREAAKKYT